MEEKEAYSAEATRKILRVEVTQTGQEPASPTGNLTVNLEGKRFVSGWDPYRQPGYRELAKKMKAFHSGDFNLEDLAAIDRQLGRLFLPGRKRRNEFLESDHSAYQEIQLAIQANPNIFRNLPWEVIGASQFGPSNLVQEVVERTWASRPVVRIIEGEGGNTKPEGRLRALICISNPGGNQPSSPSSQMARLPVVDVGEFAKTIEQSFGQHRLIDTIWAGVGNNAITSEHFYACIRQQRPHILVLVAHGHSGEDFGDVPQVYFANGWVSIAGLTQQFKEPGVRPGLVVLICCDLGWSLNGPCAVSAAQLLAEAGVGEIVAIRGRIDQTVARFFLDTFLSDLLVGRSVPKAVAAGRLAAKTSLQAFLPSTFRNEKCIDGDRMIEHSMREYERELNVLRLIIPLPTDRYLQREKLETRIDEAFDSVGVFIVQGRPYSGRTQLVTQVAHKRLGDRTRPPPRPFFYIDCEKLSADHQGIEKLLGIISVFCAKHTEVLPEGAPRRLGLVRQDRVWAEIDGWGIVLILDHCPWPQQKSGQQAWRTFVDGGRAMKNSLAVVIMNATGSDIPKPDIAVPYFTEEETRAYVEKFMSQEVHRAEAIRTYTGGTPVLLDALCSVKESGGQINLDDGGLFSKAAVAATYARTITEAMTAEERRALACVMLLPSACDQDLVKKYLLPAEAYKALQRSIDLGVAQVTAAPNNKTLVVVPPAKKTLLAKHLATELKEAATTVCEAFRNAAATDLPSEVLRIYSSVGGKAFLRAVQQAFIREGKQAVAEAIPILVDDGGATRDLLDLYQAGLDSFGEKSAVENLINTVLVSGALGESAVSERVLGLLKKRRLSSYDRARLCYARAMVNKDERQRAELKGIKEDLNRCIKMAMTVIESRKQPKEGRHSWEAILVQALEKRIHVNLFLEKCDVALVQANLGQLHKLVGESAQYGNGLTSVAEALIDRSEAKAIDWSEVARVLLDAIRLIDGTADKRIASYVHYQYARYLRKKPDPELQEAEQMYAMAEEEARVAGERRREVLAGVHGTELFWERSAPASRSQRGREACDRLDRLIGLVESERLDALTLRALQRLYTLRARIGRVANLGRTERFLLEGCRISGSPILDGSRDKALFAQSVEAYMGMLHEQGNFVSAQRFVSEMTNPLLSKLEITVHLDKPWQVLEDVKQRTIQN